MRIIYMQEVRYCRFMLEGRQPMNNIMRLLRSSGGTEGGRVFLLRVSQGLVVIINSSWGSVWNVSIASSAVAHFRV